jgi:hypothetical protein
MISFLIKKLYCYQQHAISSSIDDLTILLIFQQNLLWSRISITKWWNNELTQRNKKRSFVYIIIIINSYSLWHRLETTHAKNAICITERKILKKKKNSSTSIQSLSLFSDDVASFKCRVNDVFELFICCRFQYQKLKIVCVTNQTNEMSNVLIEIFFSQWKLS